IGRGQSTVADISTPVPGKRSKTIRAYTDKLSGVILCTLLEYVRNASADGRSHALSGQEFMVAHDMMSLPQATAITHLRDKPATPDWNTNTSAAWAATTR